jgi:hypothetical protein
MPREEWEQQIELSSALEEMLDPADSFSTAFDSVAPSALSGYLRRRRGVKAGLPDMWILHRKRLITIELKSRAGRCRPSQKIVREAIERAGGTWWLCCTARSALVALHRSGVPLWERSEGERRKRWVPPEMPSWEEPRRNPSEPRPWAPDVAVRRRAARQRWRERQRRIRENPQPPDDQERLQAAR